MTVSSTVSKQTFACDGTTTVFTCPFRVLATADLRGFLITVSTQASVELTNGVDFVVSRVGDANAVATTTAAYSSAYQLKLVRSTSRLQLTDYRDNDPFPAEAHEEALDRLTHITQEQDGALSRAITLPEPETGAEVPSAFERASKLFGFDSTGAPEASAFTQAQVAAAISALSPNGTSGTIILRELHTATAGQTVFNLANTYAPGVNALFVIVDDAPLPSLVDYAETDSDTVTFNAGLLEGQQVEFLIGRLVTSGVDAAQVSTQVSGAVARTQADANLDDVTALDYLTTQQRADVRTYAYTLDVTTALQAAHDALPASGGDISLPAGGYRISAALNISKPNVTIRGAGRKSTKIVQYTAGAKTLNITDEYCTVTGLSIEYNSQGTSGGSAIYSAEFYGSFSDVYIKKAFVGFHFAAGANSNYLNRFGVEDYTSVGVYCIGASNILASQFSLLCSDTSTLGLLGAIRLENQVEGCVFSDGQTYEGVYALTTEAATYALNSRPGYNKFNSVFFDSAANGALLNEAVETDFNNCWFSNRPENGIIVSTCDGVRFNGGGAINCAKHGVLIESTVSRVAFTGFASRGNGTATSNTYSGIAIAANTNDFTVQGCTLGGAIGFGTQKYGIDILAGTSDRYIVADNLITGNGTGGVNDGGTGVNKRVENNY